MKLYTPKREFKVSKLKRANKNEAFSTKFISNPYKGDPWLIALEKQSMEVLSKETGYEPKDIKEIVKIEDVYFEKWYQQLEQKESGFTFDFNRTDPSEMDYSFYDSKEYIWTTYTCWNSWTKNSTFLFINALKTIGYKPKRILDFGAGIGLSTLAIAKAFPEAEVLYYNVGDIQYNVFESLRKSSGLTNVKATREYLNVDVDVYVAFEVFEHFANPEEVIRPIAEQESTKMICHASSFTQPGTGHFNQYRFEGKQFAQVNPFTGEKMKDFKEKTLKSEWTRGKSVSVQLTKRVFSPLGYLPLMKFTNNEYKIFGNRPAILIRS